eukprot:6771352-Prymnesium_polylepis.1
MRRHVDDNVGTQVLNQVIAECDESVVERRRAERIPKRVRRVRRPQAEELVPSEPDDHGAVAGRERGVLDEELEGTKVMQRHRTALTEDKLNFVPGLEAYESLRAGH